MSKRVDISKLSHDELLEIVAQKQAQDEEAMREEQYLSDRGDAHREARYGKGL